MTAKATSLTFQPIWRVGIQRLRSLASPSRWRGPRVAGQQAHVAPRQAVAEPAAADQGQQRARRDRRAGVRRTRRPTSGRSRSASPAPASTAAHRRAQTHAGMVPGRPYTPDVPRWLAVGLGCVTALGMQALFGALAGRVGPGRLGGSRATRCCSCALVLGGYVTGHLVGRLQVLYAALVAVVFILLTATFQATREAIVARQFGLAALAPIDFLQLTLTDVLAMTGASCRRLAGRAFSAHRQTPV